MAETALMELGNKQKLGDDCQKMTLVLPGTYGKVRFNVASSLWIYHAAIFNNFKKV